MINKNKVFIHYHYKEGQIFRKPEEIDRNDLLSQGKIGDKNENGEENNMETNKKHQFFTFIKELEQKCYTSIKANEDQAHTERGSRRDNEKSIQQLRMQPNPEDIYTKILEKSIYEKARDKMK